jgi:predicted DNA-binding transcriptional regulator AlpA
MTTTAPQRLPLLKTPEAAAYTGLSVSSLTKFRCAGKGPRFVRLCGAVRYRPEDLDDWMKGGLVETEDSRRQAARA